jgi:hypothetical protein
MPGCSINYTIIVIEKFVIPIAVAVVTYWLFKKSDEYIKRREYSTLGLAVMETLLEEINNGITIMREHALLPVPVKSWDGVKTISDDVLLRIIAVTRDCHPITFPPREIRIHCKNYFEHMSLNWSVAIQREDLTYMHALTTEYQYVQAAERVKVMLVQCKGLLEENVKKKFPR